MCANPIFTGPDAEGRVGKTSTPFTAPAKPPFGVRGDEADKVVSLGSLRCGGCFPGSDRTGAPIPAPLFVAVIR
jgi:hypothetical protein